MSSPILIVVFVYYLLIHPSQALDKVRLNKDGQFVGANGQILLFHGFNSVQKGPPWYDRQMKNRTQLQMFQSWGVNVVRLGIMWPGVMPNKGIVSEEYLGHIREIVESCQEFGIYVLLDMHQDVLSTRFGTYEGIPTWLVDELPKPRASRAYPWPFSAPPAQWFENYLTYACVNCAEQLYTNVSGAWEHWGQFWEVVAQRFGKYPNVIGYELINEPPMSNFYENPERLLPGYVGLHHLLPTYDYLVNRIRAVDSDTLIFYEPLTYGVFLPDSILDTGTGFNRVPGLLQDHKAAEKSVLSYHYYCWLLQTADPARAMHWWEKVICDHGLMPSVFANSRRSIERTGGGRFLTEFGLCGPDGNPHSINTVECDALMIKADEEFQSWMYWDGNFLDRVGNPIETQVRFFVRPYPKTTRGSPDRLRFDPKTGEFRYSFELDTSKLTVEQLVAEIFVPNQVQYTTGAVVRVTPPSIKSVMEGDLLRLFTGTMLSEGKIKVVVQISRS
ncbi:Glycoside hydrolase subgroup catalytic core [Fasciola hepatica]|uniref:Glycoside hydrolase subgroup catalytic core n=1 Tax=Fasciola hepatica TaxID=6192 RepID=A0A2H1CEZ1_FASHE|nr:Glycoside hydrolase subgroup catalytic core [Fasciola hepatica]